MDYREIDWTSKESVLRAIKEMTLHDLSYLSDELKEDPEIFLENIKKWPNSLGYASYKLLTNPKFILECVKICPVTYLTPYYCSFIKLMTDIDSETMTEVKLTALAGEPMLLEHIKEYNNNFDVVLACVKKNGLSLKHADPTLQDNFEIAYEAVKQNPKAYLFVSDRLKKHPKIVLATITNDIKFISYLDMPKAYQQLVQDYLKLNFSDLEKYINSKIDPEISESQPNSNQ